MASKIDELEAEALSLPVAERARLVSRLLASLDEQVDEDVELAWIEEAASGSRVPLHPDGRRCLPADRGISRCGFTSGP